MPSFWDSSIRLDLLLSEAIGEMTAMDRLKEKLTRASGVAKRVTESIEQQADALIAREEELASKAANAFKPHHALLDNNKRELDQLEDALKLVSNDPLADGSSPEVEPATFPGQ
jgi:hypothetical protein